MSILSLYREHRQCCYYQKCVKGFFSNVRVGQMTRQVSNDRTGISQEWKCKFQSYTVNQNKGAISKYV